MMLLLSDTVTNYPPFLQQEEEKRHYSRQMIIYICGLFNYAASISNYTYTKA
jgi:hypothetical protein